MSERDPNELGALWIKQGAKGEYMTGKIGDQPVVIFRNGNKKDGSNAPDWRVLKPQKQERTSGPVPQAQNVTDDDIEF